MFNVRRATQWAFSGLGVNPKVDSETTDLVILILKQVASPSLCQPNLKRILVSAKTKIRGKGNVKPWTYYQMDLAYQLKKSHSCCVASWENDVTFWLLMVGD